MSFPTMEKQQMRTLRWVLVAAVAVLVSCGGGSSLTQESPIIDCEANSANVDIWTPDLWVVAGYCYKVGDTGPGGGIIVYVDEAGFYNSVDRSIGAMCMRGTCHYLEMALSDLEGQYSWDDAMVAAEAFSTPSANDWLLPSQDALLLIYRFSSRGGGGFSPDYYWSSSEGDDNYAWSQRFKDGWQSYYLKYSPYYVRPVRAF